MTNVLEVKGIRNTIVEDDIIREVKTENEDVGRLMDMVSDLLSLIKSTLSSGVSGRGINDYLANLKYLLELETVGFEEYMKEEKGNYDDIMLESSDREIRKTHGLINDVPLCDTNLDNIEEDLGEGVRVIIDNGRVRLYKDNVLIKDIEKSKVAMGKSDLIWSALTNYEAGVLISDRDIPGMIPSRRKGNRVKNGIRLYNMENLLLKD